MTASSTSSPLWAGRQCMNMERLPVLDMSSSVTR
jgi:hypothetical protein